MNTRDELALSQVINIPHRGLGHQQFTALRKVAREKNMPMFQVGECCATTLLLKIYKTLAAVFSWRQGTHVIVKCLRNCRPQQDTKMNNEF